MNGMRFSVAMVVSLILLAIPAVAPAQDQPKASPFTVARLVITTAINDREPADTLEVVPAATAKIHCFLEAANVKEATQVAFVWLHGEKEMLRTELPLPAGARWRTGAEKNLRGLTGDWKVEIRDAAGTVVKAVAFKVQ